MPGCPCDGSPLLLVMSECSGHADRNRTSVDTADFCSYLSDCTSRPAHHHLLHGHLLARLVLKTDVRSMGSIEAEADAGLLKPTSELQAGCCCAPGACIACTTCGAELLACMGCQSTDSRPRHTTTGHGGEGLAV